MNIGTTWLRLGVYIFVASCRPFTTPATMAGAESRTAPRLLVVAAHADDEGIFFGGVLPYYSSVLHWPTSLVTMVSDVKGADYGIRERELRRAAAIYGVTREPIFARFLDHAHMPDGFFSLDHTWDAWDGDDTDGVVDADADGVPDGRQRGAAFVATVIRRFQPDVVVTHDLEGEYGHAGHIATALATVDAFALAADPAVDLEGLPAWSVKKLYVHLYGDDRLFHEGWEEARPELAGHSARAVANLGLAEHVSQGPLEVSTFYRSGEDFDGYDAEWWGLMRSRVGPDTDDGQDSRGDFAARLCCR